MRVCCFTGAVLLIALNLDGDSALAQGTKYAGEFLRIGVGPRALGMGGAFVAVADDVTAGYWNPAGMAQLDSRVAALMHSEQISGLAYDYAAYVHPRGNTESRSALGISLIRLGLDDIPITLLPDPGRPIDALLDDGQRNRPFIDRFVSNVEYALFLSYARRTSSRLHVGGNLKVLQKSLGVASAFGLGLDVGILARPTDRIALGLQVQNITSTILTWNTGRKEYIAPLIKAGLAYSRPLKSLQGQILIAADLDVLMEERRQSQASIGRASTKGHIGIEYLLKQSVALRLGASAPGLTAGIGLRVPRFELLRTSLAPSVDYAFVNDDAFGAVHRVGASIAF